MRRRGVYMVKKVANKRARKKDSKNNGKKVTKKTVAKRSVRKKLPMDVKVTLDLFKKIFGYYKGVKITIEHPSKFNPKEDVECAVTIDCESKYVQKFNLYVPYNLLYMVLDLLAKEKIIQISNSNADATKVVKEYQIVRGE